MDEVVELFSEQCGIPYQVSFLLVNHLYTSYTFEDIIRDYGNLPFLIHNHPRYNRYVMIYYAQYYGHLHLTDMIYSLDHIFNILCYEGNLEYLQKIYQSSLDLDTAISFAIQGRRYDVVRWLLSVPRDCSLRVAKRTAIEFHDTRALRLLGISNSISNYC